MNARQWNIVEQELAHQCIYALKCLDAIYAALDEQPLALPYDDHVWLPVQSLLAAVGISSNLLFGPGRRKRAFDRQEAAELRDRLGIGNDHILGSRAVRDGFMHIDERLRDWARSNQPMVLADRLAARVRNPLELPMTTLRFLHPDSRTLTVLDDSLSLPELERALRLLLHTLSGETWPTTSEVVSKKILVRNGLGQ